MIYITSEDEKVNCPCPCYKGILQRVGVKVHSFLTSLLVGGERSTSYASCFTTGSKAIALETGGLVDFRVALDILEN
jgi:hypothetical protein